MAGSEMPEPISAEMLGLPQPTGHYSIAIRGQGLLFVSGQLPTAAAGVDPRDVPFDRQVREVLERIVNIVEKSGSRREEIVKVTAFIVGVENWPQFNAVYAEIFGDHRPARSVVPVPVLHHGWSVEVEAIAGDHAGSLKQTTRK